MSVPHITDLRSYLEALEEAGELSRVKIPVSLDQEIGAICLRNLRGNGPGLLFERPGDGNLPLAVDLMAAHQYASGAGYRRARGVPAERDDREGRGFVQASRADLERA
jgi:3-polyprenyl-4-hydroxybenzoate decarboxylase